MVFSGFLKKQFTPATTKDAFNLGTVKDGTLSVSPVQWYHGCILQASAIGQKEIS